MPYRYRKRKVRPYKKKVRRGMAYKRRKIGFSPRNVPCKRYSPPNGSPTRTEYQLYADEFTQLEKTASNDINARQRNIVTLKGLKWYIHAMNSGAYPVTFNFAIIGYKHLSASPTTLGTQFFRNGGIAFSSAANDRALDFATANMNGHDFETLPINADRYTILKHKKCLLGPADGNTNTSYYTQLPNSRRCNGYMKINRNIRYDSDEADTSDYKISLVYWFSKADDTAANVTTKIGTPPNAQVVNQRFVTYFREPKN